ncbi:MAG: Pyruvate:ferredoxin oxidoreductase [Candidatus Alkanophagales archaeon MCA70_species_1]|nr:Pyruvate:ferredoxin oxidoreductase [Candidatus Alkanophaga volatiphilum]
MPVSPFQIYALLPKTNCKKCGYTCMGFAAALASMEAEPEACPELLKPEFAENLKKIKELLPKGEKAETGLIITEERCIGCGVCVVVCEENRTNVEIAAGKGPRLGDAAVLRVENGVIKLVTPERCKRALKTPVFCRACVEHCPTGAIELVG